MSDTTAIIPAGEWYYNLIDKVWDRAVRQEDGSYLVYRWNETTKRWSDEVTLHTMTNPISGKVPSKTDFEYWYCVAKSVPMPDPSGYGSISIVTYEVPGDGMIYAWNEKNERIPISSLNTGRKTYIVIHGLNNSIFVDSDGFIVGGSWITDMVTTLKKTDSSAQVFAVYWDSILDWFASGVKPSAEKSAILLRQLCEVQGESLASFVTNNLNLIGHSYGAHYSAWLSKYLGSKPVSLVGLDSAEEKHQIGDTSSALGKDVAQEVFFYKSSDYLGGGDTWNEGDRLLGQYNFYLPKIFSLTAKDGLSTGLDGDEHGYACRYYIASANGGSMGLNLDRKILADIEKAPVTWHGIVNQSFNKIECVTLGYELEDSDEAVTMGWKYSDYMAAVDRIVSEPFFKGEISSLDMPKEIYAVAFMTALDIQKYSIDGNEVKENKEGKTDPSVTIEVGSNTQFSVSFDVRNYADNLSFALDEISAAQENLYSTNEIWVSLGEELNVSDSKTCERLYCSDIFKVKPSGLHQVSTSVEITDEILDKLLSSDAAKKKQFETEGKVDLYLHARTGVNAEDSTKYIAGELQEKDNLLTQKITVVDDGIRVAFVIDTTGSMGDEISSVRDALLRKIEEFAALEGEDGKVPKMMLVTFKDNHTVNLITDSLKEMYDAVRGLSAWGGGDTPEHSNHALNTAINMLAKGGKVFIATDAPSHSGPNITNMVNLAKEKEIKVTVLVTGHLDSSGSAIEVDDSAAEAYSLRSVSPMMLTSADIDPADADDGTSEEESEAMDDVVDGATRIGVGDSIEGTVSFVGDRYDWYCVDLEREYTYSISLDTGDERGFMTLYAEDGETELRVVPSGNRISFCPDESGTYYVKVRAYGFADTPYKLDVQETAKPSGVGSSVESFSVLATETGGVFYAHESSGWYGDMEKYESTVYNLLTSMDSAAVISVAPNDVPVGTTVSVEVVGMGTNWRSGQTNVSFGSAGITVNSVDVVSPTKLIANITVAEDCEMSLYGIVVSCGSEVAKGEGVLSIVSEPYYRSILSVTLTSSVTGGAFTATVNGYETNWDSTTRLSFGPGVTVGTVEVLNATTIKVTGTIDEDAELGYRTVNVKTDSETLSLARAFFVSATAALSPEIVLITPSALTPGEVATLTITGKNVDFTGRSITVDMGAGVEIKSVEVLDATTLKVEVKVSDEVVEGFRNVKVHIDEEVAIALNGLDISTMAEAPYISLVSPGTLRTGVENVLTIKAANLDFTGGEVMVNLGEGITIRKIEVVDASTIKVTASVSAESESGLRDVIVNVNGMSAVLFNGVDVEISNNTPRDAISLPFSSDNRVYRVDSLGSADEVDYFRITPDATASYRVALDAGELLQQVVLSVGTVSAEGVFSAFRSIVVDSTSRLEEISGLALDGGEDYYIAVRSTGMGEDKVQTPYTLSIDPSSGSAVSDDNTIEKATRLSWSETSAPAGRAWVGCGDSLDYYRFEMDCSAEVCMKVSGLTSAARVTVYKQNAEGGLTQVATNSVRSGGLEQVLSLTDGTYFLQMASYDNGAGRYNTTYSLELEKEDETDTRRFAIANS